MKKQIILKAAIVAVVIVAVGVAQPVGATQYVWRSAVRSGLFSNYNCWQYKDANNVYQVADASHHLTTDDDFSFWLQPSAGYYYVTNDTSIAFNGGQFSFGLYDVAGNMSTKSGTHIRIGTSGTAPYLAVVNKHDGNWTIGQDLFIGRNINNCGVLTNLSGNITASSGWIYLGGDTNGGGIYDATGRLVNVSGTISTKTMIVGGKANRTLGILEVKGGNVTITSWQKFDGEWCGVLMAGWGGARGEIRIAKGAVMSLTASGANIGVGEGANVIAIDGTLRLPTNGNVFRIDKGTASTGGTQITIGKDGRLECQSVTLYNDGGSGSRRLTLDGGTFAPSGNADYPLANLTLAISQKNGMLEVPSGKTVYSGVWVQDYSSSNKGRLIKTGAGTLNINNYFRPSRGLRVNSGTVQITHNSGNFTSYNYPLSISKTGTVTSGAFVMGSGGSLEFEHTNKTSGATMNITTSFTRNANIPITFSTESAFGFDDTYTLVKGGKITNTNNFSIASATANGVDITDGVYLAVESGNLVLKRSPYFYIRIAEACSLEIPKTWVDANISGDYPGETDAFKTVLSGTGANGIPRWQSYCLGLQPTNSRSVVLCDLAKEQPAEAGAFKFTTNVAIPDGLSGVAVTASLDRKSGTGDWVQQGESQTVGTAGSGSPVEFTADADPENALSFFV